MRSFYPLIFAAVMSLITSGIIIFLLRFLHHDWWREKAVRYPAIILAAGGLFSLIIWVTGIFIDLRPVSFIGAILATGIFLLQLSLVISLPFSGLLHLLANVLSYFKNKQVSRERPDQVERRNFIKSSAAFLPAIALSSQVIGIANSYKKINVPVIKLPVTNLPDSLQGLKIAHLSDSHLGHYTTLDDLEEAVGEIRSHTPDLVFVTGDISDDLTILEDANRIINSIQPPLGVYASVGNHEYYRGIKTVKKVFEKSDFPLLINENVTIEKDNTKIFIGGADDPVSLRKVSTDFLRDTVEKTLDGAPFDSFKILMSHRPRGLDYASMLNVNLVLAGHTHGGQMGMFGRSAFEIVWPEIYFWGIYRKDNTTLYTSSGMGHWMPFRLGCPAEAPILILEKEKTVKNGLR